MKRVVFPKRLKKQIEAGIRAMLEIERRNYHFLNEAREARRLLEAIAECDGRPAPGSFALNEKCFW